MSSSTIDEQDFSDSADGQLVVGTSLWQDAWRRLKKNRMALASAWTVALMTAACIIGPFIIKATWGYDYETQDLEYNAQPPSLQHWFGTDFFGRDLLTSCAETRCASWLSETASVKQNAKTRNVKLLGICLNSEQVSVGGDVQIAVGPKSTVAGTFAGYESAE